MKIDDNVFFEVIFATGMVIVAFIVLVYSTDNPIPDRISSFCKVNYEVYGKPYDECIASYKQHQESK